jgi:hypothetical protein
LSPLLGDLRGKRLRFPRAIDARDHIEWARRFTNPAGHP